MNLATFLEIKNIVLDIDSQDHMESILEVMAKIPQNGRLRNKQIAIKDLLDREKLSSTGIGGGFAVPHVFTEEANVPTLVFARSKKGIEFESIDRKPVHLMLMAFAHPRKKTFFIQCLYHIVSLLKDPTVYHQLLACDGPEEVLRIFEKRCEKPSMDLFKPLHDGNGNGHGKAGEEAFVRPGIAVGQFLEEAVKGVRS